MLRFSPSTFFASITRAGRQLFGAAALASISVSAAADTDLTRMTDAEREAFRAEVRALIAEEPELILEALQSLERRQREEQERAAQDALAARADAIFNDDFSYVGGNPEGDLTLVEFLDYRCGFCKRAHPHVADFLEMDGGVRLVVKEFPVLGPDSEYAGRAAMASLLQQEGALYKPFHDAMIEHRGQLTDATVKMLAREVGLNVPVLENDMRRPEIAANLEQTYEIAGALGINGTPAFILGDQIVRGFIPSEALHDLADEIRAARTAN